MNTSGGGGGGGGMKTQKVKKFPEKSQEVKFHKIYHLESQNFTKGCQKNQIFVGGTRKKVKSVQVKVKNQFCK